MTIADSSANAVVPLPIVEYLKRSATPSASRLLAGGRLYKVTDQTFRHPRAEPKMCFRNAVTVAASSTNAGSWRYCEGLAILETDIPVHHAWLVNLEGHVRDDTVWWPTTDPIFFGLTFTDEEIRLAWSAFQCGESPPRLLLSTAHMTDEALRVARHMAVAGRNPEAEWFMLAAASFLRREVNIPPDHAERRGVYAEVLAALGDLRQAEQLRAAIRPTKAAA